MIAVGLADEPSQRLIVRMAMERSKYLCIVWNCTTDCLEGLFARSS